MKKTSAILTSLFLLAGLTTFSLASFARASTEPVANGVLLSEILEKVEAENIGVVIEAEHEHNQWEIEACTTESCTDIKFDAKTGNELKRRAEKSDDALPPEGAKPLSEIVKTFEEYQYPIIEIEFEDGIWEVLWMKDGRKVKSFLDPMTAKNVSK